MSTIQDFRRHSPTTNGPTAKYWPHWEPATPPPRLPWTAWPTFSPPSMCVRSTPAGKRRFSRCGLISRSPNAGARSRQTRRLWKDYLKRAQGSGPFRTRSSYKNTKETPWTSRVDDIPHARHPALRLPSGKIASDCGRGFTPARRISFTPFRQGFVANLWLRMNLCGRGNSPVS